jgi:hypothetical protein
MSKEDLKKIFPQGVFQKFNQKNSGRIYPSDSFDKSVSEFLSSRGEIWSTRGVVTVLGSELYAKFSSTEEDLLASYEMFLSYPDTLIVFEAFRRLINLKEKAIKKKYT